MIQWLKECTHNCIVHPAMMFLPGFIGEKLHSVNANWVWPPKCPITGMTEKQSHELSNAMVRAIENRDYTKPFVFVEA